MHCSLLYFLIIILVYESKAEISVLSPRVAFLDHQRLVLNVDNSVLKQRIAALSQDKVFKDGKPQTLKSCKVYCIHCVIREFHIVLYLWICYEC